MRVDGYIRVSSVRGRDRDGGERFLSPTLQREQIEAWARLNDETLVEIYEELDVSGARSNRPLLERALRRIEAGESDGLVVAKVNRFSRSLLGGLPAIDRIHRSG